MKKALVKISLIICLFSLSPLSVSIAKAGGDTWLVNTDDLKTGRVIKADIGLIGLSVYVVIDENGSLYFSEPVNAEIPLGTTVAFVVKTGTKSTIIIRDIVRK
jgi:hypothetical protein